MFVGYFKTNPVSLSLCVSYFVQILLTPLALLGIVFLALFIGLMGYSLLSTFPETDEKIIGEDNGLFDNLNLECSSETIYNSETDLCE